jgi:hypothetical protein
MNKITIERRSQNLFVVREDDMYTQPVSAVEVIGIVAASLATPLAPMRCHLKTAYQHKRQKASIDSFLKLDGQIENINIPQE